MNLLDDISHQPQQPASPCTVQQEVDRDVEMIAEMTDDPPTQNETEDSESTIASLNTHKPSFLPHGDGVLSIKINKRIIPSYPELLEKDGIYSGFYRPPTNGKYRISVLLDGLRRSNPITIFDNPSSRSMPINQSIIHLTTM